ncbi:hypothetical protein BSK59_15645 [Paenibacillus odorifer]|uniref:hypothetical protein n=1 Tax=Paenibacillus odorifer TaxID=189426 RepID=UPI00096CCEBB|nr:hypothetical protein [Paenibacillus odorifer]OME54013.1 hypothetical protein BSK59_15645 [Paenibacillus odorifer]
MTTTTKTNEKSNTGTNKSFEDILNELINDTTKKIAMMQAVDEAVEKMKEEMETQGDMVMGSVEVTECSCPKKCGAVMVSAEFIAMTFTPEGIEVKEGTIQNILSFK